jgi:hypothetical protein
MATALERAETIRQAAHVRWPQQAGRWPTTVTARHPVGACRAGCGLRGWQMVFGSRLFRSWSGDRSMYSVSGTPCCCSRSDRWSLAMPAAADHSLASPDTRPSERRAGRAPLRRSAAQPVTPGTSPFLLPFAASATRCWPSYPLTSADAVLAEVSPPVGRVAAGGIRGDAAEQARKDRGGCETRRNKSGCVHIAIINHRRKFVYPPEDVILAAGHDVESMAYTSGCWIPGDLRGLARRSAPTPASSPAAE